MSLFGDWLSARRARWRSTALKETAEAEKHARRVQLVKLQVKTPTDLAELRLLESSTFGWQDWVGPWREWNGAYLDFARGGFGAGGGVTDHTRTNRYGDFPFYDSEPKLAMLRDTSRILYKTDPNAEGLLNGLLAFVIGDGASVRVVPKKGFDAKVAEPAQALVDQWTTANAWDQKQEEFFLRSRRDGEAIWQLFPQNYDLPQIRWVWPEQIRKPPGELDSTYGYGVKSPEDDRESVEAFAVYPVGSEVGPEDYDEVPADRIIRIALNVDSGIPRGIPDFAFGMEDTLTAADKLAVNMGIGSQMQAAIAYVRQHEGAPKEQIQALQFNDSSFNRPNPITGVNDPVKLSQPGIVDTNKFTTFVPSPYNAGVQGHLEVGKMLLRRACVKWNAPEWLGSADASNNNFASSLTAESPFVKRVKSIQRAYATVFRKLFERILFYAVEAGLLAAEILDQVEIKVTFPNPQARDPKEEADANDVKIRNRYKSPQMCAEEDGTDYGRVEKDFKELEAKGLVPQPGGSGGASGQPGAGATPGAPTARPSPNGNGKPPSQNGNGKPPTYDGPKSKVPSYSTREAVLDAFRGITERLQPAQPDPHVRQLAESVRALAEREPVPIVTPNIAEIVEAFRGAVEELRLTPTPDPAIRELAEAVRDLVARPAPEPAPSHVVQVYRGKAGGHVKESEIVRDGAGNVIETIEDDVTVVRESEVVRDANGLVVRVVTRERQELQEAWSEDDHPRDDDGRFVDAGDMVAAKSDPGKADELRKRVTNPGERKKLDAAIGGSKKSPAKKPEAATGDLASHIDRTKTLQANQADTSPEHVQDVLSHVVELNKLSKDQLRSIAKETGIEGIYTGSSKAEILTRIQNHLTVGWRAQDRSRV